MSVGGRSLRTAQRDYPSEVRLMRVFSFPSLRVFDQSALAELATGETSLV
jgi:hypothetical protein